MRDKFQQVSSIAAADCTGLQEEQAWVTGIIGTSQTAVHHPCLQPIPSYFTNSPDTLTSRNSDTPNHVQFQEPTADDDSDEANWDEGAPATHKCAASGNVGAARVAGRGQSDRVLSTLRNSRNRQKLLARKLLHQQTFLGRRLETSSHGPTSAVPAVPCPRCIVEVVSKRARRGGTLWTCLRYQNCQTTKTMAEGQITSAERNASRWTSFFCVLTNAEAQLGKCQSRPFDVVKKSPVPIC